MKPYTPPAVTTRARCLIEGCDRLEELANGRSAGGLCAGHRKRKAQGRPLHEPLHDRIGLQRDGSRRLSPRRALLAAAMHLGDVPTDVDGDEVYRRAVDRLTHAALVYAEAVGRKLPSK